MSLTGPIASPFRPGRLGIAILLVLVCLVSGLEAGESTRWRPLIIVRFGNIDAVDAEDGPLGRFVRSIRNDGRFIPPLHALVGPEIRNPTFFGVAYEAWMECVALIPDSPGPAERIWIFPVDSRDEYLAHLIGAGLTEYEGMDGITVLREHLPAGGLRTWYLEWLPGNVAVFGAERAAVAAARLLYAENSASRGLLTGAGGQYVNPDLLIRLEPSRLASWQYRTEGEFWWREIIELLARDLLVYWRPRPSRARLIEALADELAAWPRSLGPLDLSLWFEPEGVEWRARVTGPGRAAPVSQLPLLRRMPERSACAFALPVTPATFTNFGEIAGRLLVDAAGGAVTGEAREAAWALWSALAAGNPRELASGWVAPPPGDPEAGAARLLVMEWERPEVMEAVWREFLDALAPDSPFVQVFAQMGWEVSITPEKEEGSVGVGIRPYEGGPDLAPYYDGLLVFRRDGQRVAIAAGTGRPDELAREKVLAYRAELAAVAVAGEPEGVPDARRAFVRMGGAGAALLGFFDPVRFLQLCLVEAADWRPVSPDQEEPLSTRLAREMLEYAAGGAWTFEGNPGTEGWDFHGGMTWQSLSRLSAALGVTEAIGMNAGEP